MMKSPSKNSGGKNGLERTLFNELTSHLPSTNTQFLLKRIFKEYNDIMTACEEENHFIKTMQAKKLAIGELTKKNILNRKGELKKNITFLKQDNDRLRKILVSKQNKPLKEISDESYIELFKRKVDKDDNDNNKVLHSKLCVQTRLKNEDFVPEKLLKELEKLEKNLNILNFSVTTMFDKNEKYNELKNELIKKEMNLTEIQRNNFRMKTVAEDSQKQIKVLKKDSQLDCLEKKRCSDWTDPLLPLLQEKKFDSDEPKDQRLVSLCIIHLNRFHSEFQKGNFKLAAQLAANSPQGILRNHATYMMFKNVAEMDDKKKHPSFLFCEALINTCSFGEKIEENLSIEIISCGIAFGDANLVKFWLSRVTLTLSSTIANNLFSVCKCKLKCNCVWTMLALQVYSSLDIIAGIILCHLKLNRFEHVEKCLLEHQVSNSELKEIIAGQPLAQLTYLLCNVTVNTCCITFPSVVRCLLDNEMYENVVNLVHHVVSNGLHGKNLFDCLLQELVDDNMGADGWTEVLYQCILFGKIEVAEELNACLITRESLENALIFSLCDYIS